jgi:hypothetical protein
MGDSMGFTPDNESCFPELLFNFGQQVSVRYGIPCVCAVGCENLEEILSVYDLRSTVTK